MDIVLDLSSFSEVSNPFQAMLFLFLHGGWIGAVFAVLYGLWSGWLNYIREKFQQTIKWTLLAIDVPKNNLQTPKAVEQIFAHFTGITQKGTLKERYIDGYVQPRLSLEVVSVEGYVQFLIRTPTRYRDLVEAAVYAQYPDAEITEVEDYVDTVPKPLQFPNKDWDLWGTEFRLQNKDVFPIKTYRSFEDPTSEEPLHDPMASLLEILSRMGPGEQLWLQLVITPAAGDWYERGIRLIKRLIGAKDAKKEGFSVGAVAGGIGKGIQETVTASLIPPSELSEKPKFLERQLPTLMQHLSPHERTVVEAVGEKIAKLGFLSKFRMIYCARKEIFDRGKGVSAVIGALSQFGTQNLNAFGVHKKARTTVHYMFTEYRKKWRQRRILWGYRYRSITRGWTRFVLNTEELATIWHFPISTVRAPLVQKTEAKRGEPPTKLPVETLVRQAPSTSVSKGAPPASLPVA